MINGAPQGDLLSDPTPADLEIPRQETEPVVPWSTKDTWIGFLLFVLFMIGIGISAVLIPPKSPAVSLWFLLYQPVQFIPIWIMLRLRKATWVDLGFQNAKPNVLGLGCGLLIPLMFLNLVNNLVMISLGVEVQAEQFSNLMDVLEQPAVFLFAGVLLAPLFEEAIFRGFLFGGLRRRLGWRNAALLSSALFAIGHLQPAALIPTFALGFLFAYLYQRSNSIWPGIILHTLVNSFSMCALLMMTQYGGPINF